MNYRYLIHPFLLAMFPIASIFSHNLGVAKSDEALPVIVFALLLTIFTLIICRILFQDLFRAALCTSFLIIIIIFLGQMYPLIITARLPIAIIITILASMILVFFISILLACYVTLVSDKELLLKISKVLTVVSMIALIFPVGSIAWFELNKIVHGYEHSSSLEIIANKKPDPMPDIYYIIFDRYGSNRVLEEFYGYDNSDFTDRLAEKGFYVAYDSNANYLKTGHSLASSLNMTHITDLSKFSEKHTKDWGPITDMIQANQVVRFLKEQGYSYIHLGSWWWPTKSNLLADENINLNSMTEFASVVYESTLFYGIGAMSPPYDKNLEQWQRVQYKFSQLESMPDRIGPKFVFAHFLTPHDPYVFKENGDYNSSVFPRTIEQENKNYINQILYINKRILSLVDIIIEKSENPPIIIIQADEGPFPNRALIQLKEFNWRTATEQEVSQKLGILNSYYLPGVEESALYSSISPVNSFRVVFNEYFGTELELLPDDSYGFEDVYHLYDFFKF